MAAASNHKSRPRSWRRWFQFSLSTLLLVTAAFALCLGLWVDRANRQQRAVEQIRAMHGSVRYEHQFDSSGKETPNAEPPAPRWLRQWLGEKYFVHVRNVWLGDPARIDFSVLEELPRLRELFLSGASFDAAALAQLPSLTRLKDLYIDNQRTTGGGDEFHIDAHRMTDAGMEHLKKFANLERLYLIDTPVSDAGIMQLAGLKRLQELCLEGTHVTAEGAERLEQALPDLKISGDDLPSAPEEKAAVAKLFQMDAEVTVDKEGKVLGVRFRGPQITDASLDVLEPLTHCQYVDLAHTGVTAEGLKKLRERGARGRVVPAIFSGVAEEAEALAAMRKLYAEFTADDQGRIRTLSLDNAQLTRELTDEDLVHLDAFGHMETLSIDVPMLTDAGLEHLAGLTNLRTLSIWNSRVGGAGLVHLKGMHRLTHLGIYNVQIHCDALRHLAGLSGLEHLTLDVGPVSREGLASLAALPNLRILELTNSKVTDDDLAYLSGCKSLKVLDLGNTKVTGSGVGYLAEIPGLGELSLSACRGVTNENLAELRKLKALENLNLAFTNVTDAGLVHLEAIPSLKGVNLDYSRVSKAEQERMETLFPFESYRTRLIQEARAKLQAARRVPAATPDKEP